MNPKCSKFEQNVAVDLPYPPILTKCRRKKYAQAILSNLGGRNSEMTAVSLYFYNSVILNRAYAEFARIFHQIGMVEMRHLNIFASLAFQMGQNPRLWKIKNDEKAYWTPAYNRYPRKIREVIANSIQGELAAIQKYAKQADAIRDENIAEILHRVILDEQRHIEIFRGMLTRL